MPDSCIFNSCVKPSQIIVPSLALMICFIPYGAQMIWGVYEALGPCSFRTNSNSQMLDSEWEASFVGFL